MTTMHASRLLLLLGTLAFAGGCGAGGDVNDQAPAPSRSQAEVDAERAAREKAMNPNGPAASPPAAATK